jgi:putative hemolysin
MRKMFFQRGIRRILRQMSSAPMVALLGMVGFAAASFVFALAESALFSLGKWRARHLAEEFPKAGGQVLRLIEHPQDLLAAIVLGNTFANTALMAIAMWMSFGIEDGEPWWTIGGTFVLILFGCEVVPKTLAVRMPERWAMQLAGPLTLFQRLTAPILRFTQKITDQVLSRMVRNSTPMSGPTDEDYQELLDVAEQRGTLAQSEKEIILEIISLDQQTAGDVMLPRSQMAAIPYDLGVDELKNKAREHKHTRLPMYDETPDTIVGILNSRQLLLNSPDQFEEAIEIPSQVPESMNLLKLFQSLQRQRRGMAVVVDEYGGTAGVVTVQDILEEMIGKIRTEGESHQFLMERLGRDKWRVSGAMLLDEFRSEFPTLPDREDVDTMGGLVVALSEVVPAVGATIRFAGLVLTVTEATERRILELELESEYMLGRMER